MKNNIKIQLKGLFYTVLIIMTTVIDNPFAYSAAYKPSALQFNPALEGGVPSLSVRPLPEFASASTKLRITSFVREIPEKVLEVKEITSADSVDYVLPHRNQKDILGVRVESIQDSGTTLIVEWHALYQPGKRTLDYEGSPQLKSPSDLVRFWEKTKRKLSEYPMNEEITLQTNVTSSTGNLYKVTLNSFDNIKIVCWYFVPKDVNPRKPNSIVKKYPAVQIMPGYGAEEPPLDRTAEGIITLSVNPRGHGPSSQYFPLPPSHHIWNVDNLDKYYYRGAFMDLVRGIDFLSSRPEVDHSRIAAEGGSQGGMFTLALCALDSRIVCGCANIPFMSNLPDYVLLKSINPSDDLIWAETYNDPDKGSIYRKTMSYVDVANLANYIKCPIQICVGMQDRICPPVNGIVALNRIPKTTIKELVIDPKAEHEVPPFMRDANQRWYKKYLLKK